MRSALRILAYSLLFVCLSAEAQWSPTAGRLRAQAGGTVPAGGLTFLDTAHPVTADGSVDRVIVRWAANAPCTSAIKVRFLRPFASGTAGPLGLIGSAGPFNSKNGLNHLTFPPINVKKGDLLAVTQAKAGCGGVTFSYSAGESDAVHQIGSDWEGGLLQDAFPQVRSGMALDAVATKGDDYLVGVIPVVGSTAGAQGSFFKTSLAVTNPGVGSMNLRLVFHPAGASATPADTQAIFNIPAGATRNFDNIVATMGASGLGTLDVFSDAYEPEVSVRVYNDAGSAGTSGFSEQLVRATEALTGDRYAIFHVPSNLTNYRVNVGVRTFGQTTPITIASYNASGALADTPRTATYPPNYFAQTSLASFLGNQNVVAGGYILVAVDSGAAVFYSAVTDNRTNDGSLTLVTAR